MSATTILEAYDTQMLDYAGDFDVAMQAAGSSSDAWLFNSESVMDQDAHHDSQSLGAPDNESVEVDMEGYPGADNESVEYEMADEEQIYQLEGDLLDVEVYDASQAHSPIPIPAIDVPQTAPDNTVDYSIQPTPVFPDTHNDIAVPDPLPTLSGATHLYEPSNYELPAADNTSNSSPRFEVQQEVPGANVASTDSHSEDQIDPSTIILPTVPDGTAFHDSSGSEAFEEAAEPADKGASHDVAHGSDSHSTPHGDAAESVTISLHPQDHEEAAHLEQPHESADAAESYESAEYHDESQPYHEYNEVFAGTSDPHEISEGVYIDPPPAVLLSLPLSDVIYLFNQPSARAGSNSPTEETHQTRQHIWTVLLHHRPTLYYEPLANVFEALRQEEYIAQVPELAEGELALDAYDLQLVISEDNVHARDVTLHDLNVLHDGSDLPGPLRLHLHVIIPRFILRYHMLRDQIARLNLVAEGADSEQVAPPEHDNESNHQEDGPQKESDQDNEVKPENQYPETTDEHAEPPPDSTESAKQINETPGDISNLTVEDHDYHDVHGEDVQAPEDQDENDDADTAAEVHEDYTGENLDADAVHDEDGSAATHVTDGEPAEYEEYAEAEEYDERYGETLLGSGNDSPDNDQTLEYPKVAEHQEPTVADETQETPSETNGLQRSTVVDLAEQGDEHTSEGTNLTVGDVEDYSEEPHTNDDDVDHDDQDHDSEDTVSKHSVAGPDELDSNFVAAREHVANLTAETSTSESRERQEQDQEYPELPDDAEWDDDLDGEGDIDEDWTADPDDGVSNQSSATLSSIASSSKRGYDEIDSDNENDGGEPSPQNTSPESKRPRVH